MLQLLTGNRFTECLGYVEERLFENSKFAGQGGSPQWALDSGAHQDSWNPYTNILYEWNHKDRDEESKSELQYGPNYILPKIDSDTESTAKLVQAANITGGKPKPIKKSQAEVDDLGDTVIKRTAKHGKKWIPKRTLVGTLWKAGAPRFETSDVISPGMIAEAVP
ncbi:hypothetical protein K438DRAFT_1765729 [Mycena galopus ATCC 62051]|nr:hypothetical protein K438DRAFT_1765729 [Mycena galopus ATCC 62051]